MKIFFLYYFVYYYIPQKKIAKILIIKSNALIAPNNFISMNYADLDILQRGIFNEDIETCSYTGESFSYICKYNRESIFLNELDRIRYYYYCKIYGFVFNAGNDDENNCKNAVLSNKNKCNYNTNNSSCYEIIYNPGCEYTSLKNE